MLKRLKKWHWIVGIAALIITTILAAALTQNSEAPPAGDPIPLVNPSDIYSHAVSLLEGQENIYYRVSGTKETIIGATILTENFTQTIAHEGYGSNAQHSCVEQTLEIGNYTIKSVDYFSENTQYRTIQDAGFYTPATTDAFNVQYSPAILITAAHYSDIAGESTNTETTITFAEPTQIEAWIADNGADFISAEGTVFLDRDGKLTKSTYSVSYSQNNITFNLQITTEILVADDLSVPAPDPSGYKSISNVDIPIMLEKACGYLMNIGCITSEYSDTIFFGAFGDQRVQTIRLNTSDAETWSAQVDTLVSTSNSSKLDVVSTHTKKELFADGKYSASTDDGEYNENSNVDLDTMKRYCQNLLIGTIMLPQDIVEATLEQSDGVYCITIRASEEFAQILAEEACKTLYQSTAVLEDLTQSSVTDTITCYINIDMSTGFPVSSGFSYQGTYRISELPYRLSFQADQAYTLP